MGEFEYNHRKAFHSIAFLLVMLFSISSFIHPVQATDGPTATDVSISGTPNVGETLNGDYTFNYDVTNWQNVGTPGFSAGTADKTSIILDSSGIPYVVYSDVANGGKATVMTFNGSSWTPVGAADFSAGTATSPSLAMGSDGTFYVAYSDGANGGKVTVMTFDGANWINLGDPGFSAGAADFISLNINLYCGISCLLGGAPYVAYRDAANGNKATLMKWNGTSWENVGDPGFSPGSVQYVSLVTDPTTGIPYVAYSDGANGDAASVMDFSGGAWVDTGSPDFSAGAASDISIVLYSTGIPYVAYSDGANGGKTTVKKSSGGFAWTDLGTPGFSAGSASSVSLAISPPCAVCLFPVPYVSYSDGGNGGKATVMKYQSSSWQNVGDPGFSAGTVTATSIVVSIDDPDSLVPQFIPYVAYSDGANGDAASVMDFVAASIPQGDSTYKWYKDDVEISGETMQTYTVQSGDVGHTIKFEVTPVGDDDVAGDPVQSDGIEITAGIGDGGGTGAAIIPVSNAGELNTDNGSCCTALSSDGRYAAYQSDATNIVADDTNGRTDIFVYDKMSGTNERVSVNNGGTQGNGNSNYPSISSDGRYVVFSSGSSNLVAGDTNNTDDIFVYDRNTHTIERVSLADGGVQSDGTSFVWGKSISTDDRYVTFSSRADNLVPDDTNNTYDIFVYDRTLHTIQRVSVGNGDIEADGSSQDSSISEDGRYVAFYSDATNLVPNDTNSTTDIFFYDRNNNTTERLSVDNEGVESDNQSYDPVLSTDGRYVTFQSDGDNLVASDTNNSTDIFVYDTNTHTIERVSVSDAGEESNGASYGPSISGNGRYVSFYSYASNLVVNDVNGASDMFVYDRTTHTIEKVPSLIDSNSDAYSYFGAISLDGNYLGFESSASNLIENDPDNGQQDIFLAFLNHPAEGEDGVCGSSSGGQFQSAPSSDLCSPEQLHISVSGTGPWTWTCSGSDGGADASCSASKTSQGSLSHNCSNGLDDDGDGLTDYPNDPGCTSSTDNTEENSQVETCATNPSLCPVPPTCSSGYTLINGSCVQDQITCPEGQIMHNGTCITETCEQLHNCPPPPPVCPVGSTLVNGSCVGHTPTCQELGNCVPPPTCEQLGTCPVGNGGGNGDNGSGGDNGGSGGGIGSVLSSTFSRIHNIFETPYGDAISKTIASAGLIVGALGTIGILLFATPLSLSELILLPTRLWSLLLIAFGLKKRSPEWGRAYDFVTKQPLDPVYITLVDKEGKEVATALTDLDGRYGFLVPPGYYKMIPGKTNYIFPSIQAGHLTRDEIYLNLYFGNYFEIKNEGDVITYNMPMDPVNFDWNEFAKRDQSLMKFYSKRDILFLHVSETFFKIGFVISFFALIFAPAPYNIAIFVLYLVLAVLKEVGVNMSKVGFVFDKATGAPLAFAIVRVFSAKLGNEVIHKVTTEHGMFYCLVPNTSYYITIEKKNGDGTYTQVFKSETIDVKKGVIKGKWEV